MRYWFWCLAALASVAARAENSDIERAEKEYQNAVDNAKKVLVQKLQVELAIATRAGDLDKALAIRDKIRAYSPITAQEKTDQAKATIGATALERERDYKASVETARKLLVAKLSFELTNLTKKGDLDGALKLRARIASLEQLSDSDVIGKSDGVTFLSDIKEAEAMVGPGGFTPGKCAGGPIMVGGKESPHSLFCHALENGTAFVRYTLGGKYHILSTGCGIADSGVAPAGTFTFSIVGDNRIIWESKPLSAANRKTQEVTADISGVQNLILKIHTKGSCNSGHTIWVDPKVK